MIFLTPDAVSLSWSIEKPSHKDVLPDISDPRELISPYKGISAAGDAMSSS